MTVLLAVFALVAGIGIAIGRAFVVDEARGRLANRLRRSLAGAIETLPEDMRAEWEDEWRAELEAALPTPLTAMHLVAGIRRSARQMAGELQPEVSMITSTDSPRRPLPMRSVLPDRLRGGPARLATWIVRVPTRLGDSGLALLRQINRMLLFRTSTRASRLVQEVSTLAVVIAAFGGIAAAIAQLLA